MLYMLDYDPVFAVMAGVGDGISFATTFEVIYSHPAASASFSKLCSPSNLVLSPNTHVGNPCTPASSQEFLFLSQSMKLILENASYPKLLFDYYSGYIDWSHTW